jgi:soluble lytic murein transglycosylase-like protein
LWTIVREATATGWVSAELLLALCWVQSGFEPDALAPDGRRGLFSMHPDEARRLAPELGLDRPNLGNPYSATHLASRSLNQLLLRFDIVRALLAFRLGVSAVENGGDALLTMPEHVQYIRDVLQTMAWLAQAQPWRSTSSRPPVTSTHAYQTLVRYVCPQRDGSW